MLRSDRSGRAGGRLLSVTLTAAVGQQTRCGLVVSKAVGNAVVRNRTKRILRHLMAGRLTAVPTGSSLVIRAHPAAAGRSTAELGSELDTLLERAATKAAARAVRSGSA